jgi:predicted ATPase
VPVEFQLVEVDSGVDEEALVESSRRRSRSGTTLVPNRDEDSSRTGHVTAIIGRNGTGKSYMLSSVVQTFLLLEEIASGRVKAQKLPLRRIAYRINGQHCIVERGRSGIHAILDGVEVLPEFLPRPQRVVALTMSPFDKFPVPRSQPFSVAPVDGASAYRYLGLRDRTGRAAIENLLFRSLDSMFEAADSEPFRRANIARVFEFLKLSPFLSVMYRSRISRAVADAVHRGIDVLEPGIILDKRIFERASDVIRKERFPPGYINELIAKVLEREESGKVRFDSDFRYGGHLDPTFSELQPLRRAGFLQLSSVDIMREGRVTNLKNASSGEVSIVTALISLASAIMPGSLVLIDEPELSLHPEWQVRYIDLLLQTFSNYTGCHFVIATHSPLVVSELPRHANIVSLDERDLPPLHELAGQSADLLLAEAFGLPSSNNHYVREVILDAVQLISEGQVETLAFRESIKHVQRLSKKMDPTDPARVVISGLVEAAESRRGAKSQWKS